MFDKVFIKKRFNKEELFPIRSVLSERSILIYSNYDDAHPWLTKSDDDYNELMCKQIEEVFRIKGVLYNTFNVCDISPQSSESKSSSNVLDKDSDFVVSVNLGFPGNKEKDIDQSVFFDVQNQKKPILANKNQGILTLSRINTLNFYNPHQEPIRVIKFYFMHDAFVPYDYFYFSKVAGSTIRYKKRKEDCECGK